MWTGLQAGALYDPLSRARRAAGGACRSRRCPWAADAACARARRGVGDRRDRRQCGRPGRGTRCGAGEAAQACAGETLDTSCSTRWGARSAASLPSRTAVCAEVSASCRRLFQCPRLMRTSRVWASATPGSNTARPKKTSRALRLRRGVASRPHAVRLRSGFRGAGVNACIVHRPALRSLLRFLSFVTW